MEIDFSKEVKLLYRLSISCNRTSFQCKKYINTQPARVHNESIVSELFVNERLNWKVYRNHSAEKATRALKEDEDMS